MIPSGFQTCLGLTSGCLQQASYAKVIQEPPGARNKAEEGEPGTWVKNMDSMLLVSSSDRCSGLRRLGLSLWWDMVSSLCTVESEQMGGRGTKVRWDRERPSTPSTGICDSRGLPAADSSLVSPASDSGISFEGDGTAVTGR